MRNTILMLLTLATSFLVYPTAVLGQAQQLPGCIEGIGPLGTCVGSETEANTRFNNIISTIIGVMTVGAGIWFIFQIIIGAISWISSSGDKAQLQTAQKRITNAVIGLVIVVASITLIALIGNLLGFDILNIDLTVLAP